MRKVGMDVCRFRLEHASGKSERLESRQPPAFGFVSVDWKIVMISASGMCDMVGASPKRTLSPGIVHIKYERRMGLDCGMQRARRRPGTIPHARNAFAKPSRAQRYVSAIHQDQMA